LGALYFTLHISDYNIWQVEAIELSP